MVIAALIAFTVLLVAWILAPGEAVAQMESIQEPPETDALPVAA